MSIHIEEHGKIRCIVPDRSINDLLKQQFESMNEVKVPMVEEVNSFLVDESLTIDTPVAIFKPSSCIKESLNQLKVTS